MHDSNTFSPPPRSSHHSNGERQQALRDARLRLSELEIETHRLRARLARLEAAGEDEQAERLTEQLRSNEADIAAGLRVFGDEDIGGEDFDGENSAERSDFNSSTSLGEQALGEQAPPPRARRKSRSSSSSPSPTRRKRHRLREGQAPDLVVNINLADAAPVVARQPSSVATAAQPARKRVSPVAMLRQPGWLISILAHVVLLVLLAFATFATLQNPTPLIASGAIEGIDDEFDPLADLQLETVEIEDAMLNEVTFETLATDFNELDIEPFESLELAAGSPADALGATDLAALDAGTLMAGIGGADGQGQGAEGGGPPPSTKPGEASFFGAKSRGNRFAFVVDNSGTMKQGRMETAFMELIRSVGAMKGDQHFYVIFYSDQPYPLFYPNSADDMIPATRDNKRKLADWLTTVQLCQGGELNDAIDMAAKLSPSAVYVLSDGDIVDSRIERLLKAAEQRPFPIHTFGMTVRNPAHAAKLATIARAHGGGYLPVSVAPAAVQMSLSRPLPYNREAGPVWGTKVRKW